MHESIYTPEGMNRFYGWNNMRTATFVAAHVHTPPSAFGKIMSEIKPRMAVAYHAVLIPDLLRENIEMIRSTYDGPLTVADDLYVWNVTQESITVREAIVSDRPYPPPTSDEWGKAKRTGFAEVSDEIMQGVWKGFTPPPLPDQ